MTAPPDREGEHVHRSQISDGAPAPPLPRARLAGMPDPALPFRLPGMDHVEDALACDGRIAVEGSFATVEENELIATQKVIRIGATMGFHSQRHGRS